jgi:hypothetical protein
MDKDRLEHPMKGAFNPGCFVPMQSVFAQGSFDFPRVSTGICDFSHAIVRFFLKIEKCATLGGLA